MVKPESVIGHYFLLLFFVHFRSNFITFLPTTLFPYDYLSYVFLFMPYSHS